MNKNIYFLYGNNKFEIDLKIKEISNNFDIKFINNEISILDLIVLLNTNTFFSKGVLYVVEYDFIIDLNKDENLFKLDKYLKNSSEFSKLIIFSDKKINFNKKDIKFFKNKNLLYKFNKKNNYELEKWIKNYFLSNGYDILKEAIYFLIELIGDNQYILKNELDKIILYNDKNKIININIIKNIINSNVQCTIFQLIDALIKKNKIKVIKYLNILYNFNENEIKILYMIIREYKLILLVKWSINKKYSINKIMNELNIHSFVVKKIINIINQYNYKTIIFYLKKLYDLELKMKTGLYEPKVVFTSQLLMLC